MFLPAVRSRIESSTIVFMASLKTVIVQLAQLATGYWAFVLFWRLSIPVTSGKN